MDGMPTAHQPSPSNTLNRYLYVIAMAAVIAAGLWWRSAANPVSPFWHKYGGDALWALLMFLGFRCVLIRAPILRVTLVSLAFCFAVEFSQLYHAPWIDSIRNTRLGALTLRVARPAGQPLRRCWP